MHSKVSECDSLAARMSALELAHMLHNESSDMWTALNLELQLCYREYMILYGRNQIATRIIPSTMNFENN